VLEDFPKHVQQEVQRILDAEARRLLEEEMARNALDAKRGPDT
jgi:hypothetical protein